MIFDVFADILNGENQHHCVTGHVHPASGLCPGPGQLFSKVTTVEKPHFFSLFGGEKVRFKILRHVAENTLFTWLNFNLFKWRGQEEKDLFLPLPPGIKQRLMQKAKRRGAGRLCSL